MKYQLFQAFDMNSGSVAGPIFIFPKEAPAIREFHTLLTKQGSFLSQYPEDFILLHIGTLDEETGMIQSLHTPKDENGFTQPILPRKVASGKAWIDAHKETTEQ